MHELSVMMEVIKTVENVMAENNIKKVSAIVLQIGELSSVVPMFMEEYFPIITDQKPHFKDTELKIEVLPGNAKCDNCGTVFNVIEHKGYCPECNSFDKQLVCGKEFFIKEILVPDNEEFDEESYNSDEADENQVSE